MKELIKKFGLEEAKTSKTPMATTTKLDKDKQGINVDINLYRSMIGSLLYLTASRPDIMFNVYLCARFQSCSKESHLIAVKRIIIYPKGTIGMGLCYPKTGQFFMTIFSDANYTGCKVDRKSTSGTYQFLGNCLVSWSSKKQNSIALLTAEAEYVAAGACCAQVFWKKHTLLDYDLYYDYIKIFCDNISTIHMNKNANKHSKTAHRKSISLS